MDYALLLKKYYKISLTIGCKCHCLNHETCTYIHTKIKVRNTRVGAADMLTT